MAETIPLAPANTDYDKYGLEAPTQYSRFVAPTLRAHDTVESGRTSVVLISAPGAVGKTTLAREIARRIGSPLWHLGNVNVGHEFLTGAIARAFGDSKYSQVKGELVSGDRAFVLDGLDEARLRAGEHNLLAFLERVADDFAIPGSRPSLILLGRADVIRDTAIWLDLLGLPAAHYEIEYFEQTAATEFIGKYLDERSENRPHERNLAEFERARDLLLGRLEQAVPAGVDPRSLAGYAPVLELLSELLDVANPWAESQRIVRESEKWKLPALVKQMAVGILEREHGKTIGKLAEELRAPGFDWSEAYTPDEQCLRLLSSHTGLTLEDPPPREFPPQLRDPYEQKLKQWVGDHPFTSQPLFMEYGYAWLFSREEAPASLRMAVRAYLRQVHEGRQPYRPTPLLARFAMDFGIGEDGRLELRVGREDFGFVYESVLAGASGTERPKLTLVSSDDRSDIDGEITLGVSADAPERGQRIRISLREEGESLWLWRHLHSADIQVAHELRLGAPGVDFVLGPDVEVDCDTFRCMSSAIRVTAPRDDIAVTLSARTYEGDAVELLGRHEDRVGLRVDWAPLKYPWNPYTWPQANKIQIGPEIQDAFLKLRRILVRFRAEGYDEIARHEDLIENTAVGGSGLARLLLDFCIERRLVRRDRPWYVLDRQTMDQLGINWGDIRERRISQSIASFLAEFLEERSLESSRRVGS